MLIYITGDTHRDFGRVETFCNLYSTTTADVLIILGDAGINYSSQQRDRQLKALLAELPITLFCLHGNHEKRPETIPSYQTSFWNGGEVYQEADFPNLLFAKEGEIYGLGDSSVIAIGGAYSVDKDYRIENNLGWWPDEQPSEETKALVEQKLSSVGWAVDAVISHTTPLKYEPREAFLPGFPQGLVDKSTEKWLDSIEDRLEYKKWFCGHYHIDKEIDKISFLFNSFLDFSEFFI